jgi:tRNA pseudouridine55 synthase
MDGLLLVDKTEGISSFRVVSVVRGIIKSKTKIKLKVGHSGTLDPLANGLLVIAIGKYTKIIPSLINKEKTYIAEAKMGLTSSTGDREGVITHINNLVPTHKELNDTIKQFSGELMQTPPKYSAVKINGQRAYQLARKGEAFVIKPKKVTIFSIRLLEYRYPYFRFEATVSGGTYIRSLVEDIGNSLNTGAYMTFLRRTQIGQYNVSEAVSVEELSYSKITSSLITIEE